MSSFYETLEAIQQRPEPFSVYTADTLWTDPHIARKMLETHLNPETELASRKPEFIKRSLDFIGTRFSLDNTSRVLDLGCGPGLYTNQLAKRGAQVTGVDFSSSSLEYARAQAQNEGLSIRYRQANYLEMPAEPNQDLVLLIYGDYCPLSPAQRGKLLSLVRESLAEQGRFFFDVFTMAQLAGFQEQRSVDLLGPDNFWSASPCHLFSTVFLYEKERLFLSKHTVVEPQRIRSIYNWLQHFSLESITQELREHGFVLENAYGDVTGSPVTEDSLTLALVAKKA